MQRKLFTKLEEYQPHSLTEQLVGSVVEHILQNSAQFYQEQEIKKISTFTLTQEVMHKEIHSIGQAYIPNPKEVLLVQDLSQRNMAYESNRPFSAKIQRNSKPKCGSKKSIHRTPKKSSINYSFSGLSRQARKASPYRTNCDKFLPLPVQRISDNSFEQDYIASLRQKKIQELAYQKSKEVFLKALADESERYPKMNKKFIQLMGNKTYYYGKSGQTVEVNQNRLLKRASSNRVVLKTENTKRASQQVKTQTIVEYKQKQNAFKRNKQTLSLSDKPPLLFYKSQNCNYQIIT